MKIIELQAQNVKRLKAVAIKPDGKGLVIIAGENGAGKTSVLDSIMYALAGKDTLPAKPVRDGEKQATITLTLDEHIVTRTIKPDGSSTLTVKSRDGKSKFSSPQALLDSLMGRLSFDPLAFARMDGKRQLETLRNLVGLDFTELDKAKATRYADRLQVGRERDSLQGQLDGLPEVKDAPAKEESVTDLANELNAAYTVNAVNKQKRRAVTQIESDIQCINDLVSELERRLAEARERLAMTQDKLIDAKMEAKGLKDVDETAILNRMASIETRNAAYRKAQQRAAVVKALADKQAEYKVLTDELQEIEARREQMLAAAKFPVPELSFSEDGVLVKGVPFAQASAAEQLRVSVAMGLALNPTLKVLLVRDGSLLDAKSLQMLAAMAEEHNAQLWLERVGNADAAAVVIEDGMVAEAAGK